MSNGPAHFDWLDDLARGETLAQINYRDKTLLPETAITAGQMATKLFQDSAEALSTNHPSIANKLLGIGHRLDDIIVTGNTPVAAPSVTLAAGVTAAPPTAPTKPGPRKPQVAQVAKPNGPI